MLPSVASSSLTYVLGWALGLGSRTAVLVGPVIPIFRDEETEKRAALSTGGSPSLVSHIWLRKATSFRLNLGFRAKKSKHVGAQLFRRFSKAWRDKRSGPGRGLCVISFVSGHCALEGSGFGLGYGLMLGKEKPPWLRASQGASNAQNSSYNHAAPVLVYPSCSQKGRSLQKYSLHYCRVLQHFNFYFVKIQVVNIANQ